jgi:phage replication initiation protein
MAQVKRTALGSPKSRGVRMSANRASGVRAYGHHEVPKNACEKIENTPPTVNTGERRQADAHLNEAPYVFQKNRNVIAAQPNQELIGSYQAPVSAPIQLCMRDGKVVMQMVRIPAQTECCAIDTVRVTMHEKTIFNKSFHTMISDEDVARGFSECIEKIFGFGITKKYDKGRDFFLHAWELGDNYGHFAMGGIKQRESILIAINGQGCLAAKAGWELRLYQFLTSSDCIAPRITRVDLAHDDFDGSQLSVYDFDRAWDDGGFDRYGNRPEPQNYGSWKNNDPMGKGLTFYAGTKSSSQLFRGYQKGKQLGSPDSPWMRAEVQFSNHDKVIPFEILIDPSSYFVAAYPVLQQYSPNKTGKRTETVKKMAEAGMEHFTKYTKLGYGKFIRIARQIYGDKEFLDMVQSDKEDWPARLRIPNYEFSPTPIHRQSAPESCVPFALTASDYGYPDDDSSLHSQFPTH